MPKWILLRHRRPPPGALLLVLCPGLRRGTPEGFDDGVRRARYLGETFHIDGLDTPFVVESWYSYEPPKPRHEPTWKRERTVTMTMALQELRRQRLKGEFSAREAGIPLGTLEALRRRGDLFSPKIGVYRITAPL